MEGEVPEWESDSHTLTQVTGSKEPNRGRARGELDLVNDTPPLTWLTRVHPSMRLRKPTDDKGTRYRENEASIHYRGEGVPC